MLVIFINIQNKQTLRLKMARYFLKNLPYYANALYNLAYSNNIRT